MTGGMIPASCTNSCTRIPAVDKGLGGCEEWEEFFPIDLVRILSPSDQSASFRLHRTQKVTKNLPETYFYAEFGEYATGQAWRSIDGLVRLIANC